MNEKQLEEALRSLKIPPPDATTLERTLRRARAELDAPYTATPKRDRRPWRVIGWAAVPVAAVLAFLIFMPSLLSRQDGTPTSRSDFSFVGVEDSRRILREVRTLFPNHLKTIIIGAEGMNIRLHEEATRLSDQAILVEVSAPGVAPIQFISFSGQTIETTIADRTIRLELLLTAGNGVLIAGDDFVWTEHDPVGVTDLRIRAQRLETPL